MVVLQLLHALALFVFTQVSLPHRWVWFSFGIAYWLGSAMIMLYPALSHAKKQTNRVYGMYVMGMLSLVLAQVREID